MTGSERTVPPPKPDPSMSAVDDHRAATPTRGGTQPTAGLDPSTATDRLDTPAQGVRPEETPEVTPEGSEESPDRG